jgi:hypothetical protein
VSHNRANDPSKQQRKTVNAKRMAYQAGVSLKTMRQWLRRHEQRPGTRWLWTEDEAAKMVARFRNGGTPMGP